jgi:hypothetical protein
MVVTSDMTAPVNSTLLIMTSRTVYSLCAPSKTGRTQLFTNTPLRKHLLRVRKKTMQKQDVKSLEALQDLHAELGNLSKLGMEDIAAIDRDK